MSTYKNLSQCWPKQEQSLATYLQKDQVSSINILAIGVTPLFADLLLQVDNKHVPGNANHGTTIFSFEEVPELKIGHQNVGSDDKLEKREEGRHVHVCESP